MSEFENEAYLEITLRLRLEREGEELNNQPVHGEALFTITYLERPWIALAPQRGT